MNAGRCLFKTRTQHHRMVGEKNNKQGAPHLNYKKGWLTAPHEDEYTCPSVVWNAWGEIGC